MKSPMTKATDVTLADAASPSTPIPLKPQVFNERNP
jgi:hypothetical protein